MKKGFMSMIVYVSLLFMIMCIAAPSILYASGDNLNVDSDAEEQVNDYTDNTYRDEQSEIVEDPSNLYVSEEYMEDLNGPLPEGMTCGYGDSSGLRQTYSIDEVNNGAIDEVITLNSISDNPIMGNELYFTQVKDYDDDSLFDTRGIEVEIGKEYMIRIYIHNNNRFGEKMTAKGVHICFLIPEESGRTIGVQGIIYSSNAYPEKYWDGVVLTCKERFRLEVDQDYSCRLNGKGATNGAVVPEAINGWGPIGYNSLNGELPGCFGYSIVACIKVRAVSE